jgi:hypothetical protein
MSCRTLTAVLFPLVFAGCTHGPTPNKVFTEDWADAHDRWYDEEHAPEESMPFEDKLGAVYDQVDMSEGRPKMSWGDSKNIKLKVRFRSFVPSARISYVRSWGAPKPLPEETSYDRLDAVLAKRKAERETVLAKERVPMELVPVVVSTTAAMAKP